MDLGTVKNARKSKYRVLHFVQDDGRKTKSSKNAYMAFI
jgi:hypothetical protein